MQPEEKCLTCDGVYPLDQLAAHATECGKALLEIEREMAGKVERAKYGPPPHITVPWVTTSKALLE